MTAELCSFSPLTVESFCVFFFFLFGGVTHCSSLLPHLHFCFLSSKDAPLTLLHHSLNLSIFCHGEKHLNLSLHLFITCHLRFLLLLPFLSPPLHLCVFPAAQLLLFMPFASSISIAPRSNKHQLSWIIHLHCYPFYWTQMFLLGKGRVFPRELQ